jgi:hypothetical protein
MTLKELFEKFYDMGRLSPEQLEKGQKLFDENDFSEVDGTTFFRAISKIKENDIAKLNKGLPHKGLETLSVYNRSDYNKMKCFLGHNNSSGYAINHGDELVSVFSTKGSSGDAIMKSAVKNGAKHLDCFAFRKGKEIYGPLYSLYSRHGFKIDKSMNSGTPGEAYAIVDGVSDFVDDEGKVHPEDPRVVIFMRIS